MDRRSFLMSGAAAALFVSAPAASAAPWSRDDARRARAIYDAVFDDMLRVSPEGATSLGLDVGRRAGLRSKLGDRSPAGRLQDFGPLADAGPALSRIDRQKLSAADRIHYDTVKWASDIALEVRGFPFGGVDSYGYPVPYVLSQLTGSYQSIPDFMDSQHPVTKRADAEAYLDRLEAFARNIDHETNRAKADHGRGVTPPDFVIDRTLVQLASLRGATGEANVLVASIGRRGAAFGTGWGAKAQKIFDGKIAPALDRQIAALTALRETADHAVAARRLPDGEAYYALCLKHHTTTAYTPDETHRIGLDQVDEITAQADALLKAQGLTQGSVGERMVALSEDAAHLYPNTDAGRAELLEDLNRQVEAVRARMPELFATLPRAPVEVKRVPPAIELGAPRGYAVSPSLDGSRPGAYYINLADTGIWPRWTLPTLTYHESLPGHHLQGTIALEAEGGPMLRKVLGFNAFNEGWALYAEQLADEIGMYDAYPLGRIGMLQSFLYRAARVAIDTGLHWKGWSREQAIQYMAATVGLPLAAATSEVERYCVWPGQATGYKIGHTEFDRLRTRAKTALGPRFDLRGFHDAVLLGGGVPLAVLGRVVEEWTESRL